MRTTHRQPMLPTLDEQRAARFATTGERRALWITLLAMYASGEITRGELAAYAVALDYTPPREC